MDRALRNKYQVNGNDINAIAIGLIFRPLTRELWIDIEESVNGRLACRVDKLMADDFEMLVIAE